ncbi:MAG: class I SAM-dependent methyltransferase [Longimicrobiales bacterium]|nr:class I SAM-dependent methyltransferase [Longimicrobiales bacterium]
MPSQPSPGAPLWPPGFPRIPDAPWAAGSVEELALNYDTVENHGWYANLDFTVEQLGEYARRGDVLLDYSGGTGILAKRLLDRLGGREVGILIVDSSPKFLRLALEKFRDDPRMAFRLIPYLREERRLQRVDEVLAGPLGERGVDGIISTNAVHLYFDLEDTVRAWRRVLRPWGRLFVQSGNIRNPEMPDDEWIIDETVEVIHARAVALVRDEPRWAAYRGVLEDAAHMAAHDALRRKYFLPVRPLEHYLDVFRAQGFDVTSVRRRRIPARVEEWYEFLSVYHEGVLGWVGGAEKVTGAPAPEAVVQDRLALMRAAMDRVFGGAYEFGASWSYITCEPRAR